MNNLFKDQVEKHVKVMHDLTFLEDKIFKFFNLAKDCLNKKNKIIFCGNGGSAADCQHIASELTGRFLKERKPMAAVALTTDTSALTAIGNDYGFDQIFSRQLEAIGKSGDLLIAISTSGSSKNVISCVEKANSMKIKTVGLLGNKGGELSNICNISIVVPSNVTANIQEAHIFIGHSLCRFLDDE